MESIVIILVAGLLRASFKPLNFDLIKQF